MDRCCIDIGALTGKTTLIVQSRTLLRIAMKNDLRCCGCGDEVGLSSITCRPEVVAGLSYPHVGKQNLSMG
jgi:hypothetical protein